MKGKKNMKRKKNIKSKKKVEFSIAQIDLFFVGLSEEDRAEINKKIMKKFYYKDNRKKRLQVQREVILLEMKRRFKV